MSESPLMAAYLRERAARIEAEKRCEQLRATVARFGRHLAAIYTGLGRTRFMLEDRTWLELDDPDKDAVLQAIRDRVLAIPAQIRQAHALDTPPMPPAPKPRVWDATQPLDLDTQVMHWLPNTQPAGLPDVTRPLPLRGGNSMERL